MTLCLCNRLDAAAVETALAAGADRVALIYRLNACAPVCGLCVPAMRERLKAYRPIDGATYCEPETEAGTK